MIDIDIETHSSADLKKSGVYKYAEAPDFKILLFSYSTNGGEVQTVDLANGEDLPDEILNALTDDSVLKWAHNAQFERVCLSAWMRKNHPEILREGFLNPKSWRCSMVWAAYLGLPLSLEGVGEVIGLKEQKLSKEGKELVKYFSVEGNSPEFAPSEWDAFKQYNVRDVEVEMAIQGRLQKFPVPDFLWEEYRLDQEINDRGVAVDMQLVEAAIGMDERSRNLLIEGMRALTNLENPNSVAQIKTWLADNGFETDSLGKKEVAQMLKDAPPELAKALTLRQQLAKSSVKKYTAMRNAVCADGRARGMFQFYGTNRTGRWAGRLIQPQNLPQNHLENLDEARNVVRRGDYERVEALYGNVPDTLSQLIRTAFIPSPGRKFIVADFSSVEARVLAWLAGEPWRMDAFERGEDIYCMSAEAMFHVPVVKHGINGELRQKGKIAELACLAEGQLVLTDKGLVPIERVTADEKVWDGEAWVEHEGVIYKGEREVISYDGLTATPDHLVWVKGLSQPIPFGVAAACGTHLVKTGERTEGPEDLRTARVYDLRNAGGHHRFTVSGCLVHNCGYGGSIGALKAMGALEMGLKEDELPKLVDAWRMSNPNITEFWWNVDSAALKAVKDKTTQETAGIQFQYQSGMLFVTLPSGRKLAYVKPRIGQNKFGGDCITYEGLGTMKKWERLETYGPKLVENIVQATSRDLLAHALKALSQYDIVMHVHDEIVVEVDPSVSVEEVTEIMSETPSWAEGLRLSVSGFETAFYRKD